VVIPLKQRPWFQDAYIRCASLIAAGIMSKKTPPNSVSVIEEQLERAYKMGRRDARR
jgi:hypothetical protein